MEILKATNFNGVSGNIQFVGPSRVSVMLVKQWRDGQYHVVGHFEPDVNRADGGRSVTSSDRKHAPSRMSTGSMVAGQ